MNLIAAVDQNWAIGNHNQLLVRIPQDMKFFQDTTTGKVVVMGRHTLESFPDHAPLKNRENIVLTRNAKFQAEGVTLMHSVEELLEKLSNYDEKQVFVIGGESIYRQLLPYCDTAYITKIQRSFDADAYFPNLDQEDDWKQVKASDEQTYFNMEYFFTVYQRMGRGETCI